MRILSKARNHPGLLDRVLLEQHSPCPAITHGWSWRILYWLPILPVCTKCCMAYDRRPPCGGLFIDTGITHTWCKGLQHGTVLPA